MKYMLIHCIDENAERNRKPEEYEQGSPAIEDWITEMEGRGVLLHGDRLRYVSNAATVRVRSKELLVSDGPFAETKEQIAGYDVIDCTDLDEAIEIASKHPTAWWARSRSARTRGITAETPRSTEVTPAPASLIPMYRAVSRGKGGVQDWAG